jgi:uncharacterized protein YrrD
MKRRIKHLTGFTINGTDGEIGKVHELYFDDKTWTIRYLVIETGTWLFGRKVLLSPQSVVNTDWEQEVINVNLTMDQIKNSPERDTDKPVSRQHEIDLYTYYPWGGYYWGGNIGLSGMGLSYPLALDPAVPVTGDTAEDNSSDDDPHLRSTAKIAGYNIRAMDGKIGDVEDFIVDDSDWRIVFMLVDTGNWFPGKKVLISPFWIKEISWEKSSVVVAATEEQVKNSPEYDATQYLSDDYEANLQNYYGRFISDKE